MPSPSSHALPSELRQVAPPPEILQRAWRDSAAAGDLFAQLARLYDRMDQAYAAIARKLDFGCRDCSDSCCHQTFYHFTWVEYLYILKGLAEQPDTDRAAILEACRQNCTAAPSLRPVCGANQEGLCRLYRYRPMICRLHGIAYRLTRPDGNIIRGPGCYRFDGCSQPGEPLLELDRTEFYAAMAGLEQQLRRRLAVATRLKLTVSQMLLTYHCLQSS